MTDGEIKARKEGLKMWARKRASEITLTHHEGCTVVIRLPADMAVVGSVIEALAQEGFEVPAARGRSTMTLDGSFGKITIPIPKSK